jgi:phytanoyl-CoA hydroxylase
MTRVLSEAQLDHLAREGYLVVEDVFDPVGDLQPLIAEYDEVLDGIATALQAEGVIRSAYRELSFYDRLTQVYAESGRNVIRHFDISLPQSGIRYDTPVHLGPAVFRLLTHIRLLDVIEDVIGPEIYASPVQHIRMKLPKRAIAPEHRADGLISDIPWHQDSGQVLPEADDTTLLTVWIAITHATLENGCLEVVPRSHRGEIMTHCPGSNGLSIPEQLFAAGQAVPLPMRAGSILLLHRRLIHASLPNRTEDQVRLSFDLRYQPTGQPTGRPAFPGFIVRSVAQPERVVRDPAVWAQAWYDARSRLAGQERINVERWHADAAVCA